MTDTKDIRLRNLAVVDLSESMCAALSNNAERIFTFRMSSLCVENKRQLGGDPVTASFIRDGVTYYNGVLDRRSKVLNNTRYTKLNALLHPNLVEVYENFVAERNENLNVNRKAKNYINQVLMHSKNLNDIYALLPNKCTDEMPYSSSILFTIGNAMGPDELKEFKENHKEGVEALIKIQLLEMISTC